MIKKLKVKGIIASAVLFGVFLFVSAGLFFTAISPSNVYSDIVNNGGVIFAETSSREYQEELSADIGGVSRININLSVYGWRSSENNSYKVTQSEDENVHLLIGGTYYSTNKNNEMVFRLEKSGSVLTAEVKTEGNLFSLIPFNLINFFAGEVTVKIPAAYTGEMKLQVSAGELDFEAQNSFSLLDIDMSAGAMLVPQASAHAVKINLSAGILECQSLTANSLEVKISAGTIYLGEAAVIGESKINLSAGTLKCDKIESGSLTIDISAGTVALNEVSVSGKIYAKASAGKITVKVVSSPSEVELRLSAGTINFSHTADIDFKISYHISAGKLVAYNAKFTSDGYYNNNAACPEIKVHISAGTCNITEFTP